jgi:hypothetical protein
VTLIYLEGGARDGQADRLNDTFAQGERLVYDGPTWFGGYQRSEPFRTVPTDEGSAEVRVPVGS